MIDNSCAYPRGKALGGSTVLSELNYIRGNRWDYDQWARDNPGWAYEDVLPYFVKAENSQIDGEPGYHGTGGPVNVEYSRPYSPLRQAFFEANEILGMENLLVRDSGRGLYKKIEV